MGRELACRPLVVALLGLCAGLSSAFHVANPLLALLLVPLLWRSKSLWVLAAAVVVGVLMRPTQTVAVRVPGGRFAGEVLVSNMPALQRDSLSTIVQSGGKKYRLRLAESVDVCWGDTLKLAAEIVPLNPLAVRNHGEVAELRPIGEVTVVRRGFEGWRRAAAFRKSFIDIIERHANPRLVGLLGAVTFNVTGDLGQSLQDDLKDTGTIHIATASGLHAAIVAWALGGLFLLLPVPRLVQLALMTVFLAFYTAATGFNLPMIRSVVMVVVGSAAFCFMREADGLSSLSLAALATLLWQPEAVGSLGFQLSYISVGSLILFSDYALVPKGQGIGKRAVTWLNSIARTSLVATAATAPLLAFSFQKFPLVSILSNLLVVPVVALVVLGSLALVIVSPVSLGLSVGILKLVVEPVAAWILLCVESTARLPWATVSVPAFSPYWLILVYGLLAALAPMRKRPAESTIW